MDSTILSENLNTTSHLIPLNITNPFDNILSNETKIEYFDESKTESETEPETDTDTESENDHNWSFPPVPLNPTPTQNIFPSMLHITNLTSTIPPPPPPPPPLPMQVTINTHSSSQLNPLAPTYPPPIEIQNTPSLSNISHNILNLLSNHSNSLDGFSPEDIEESVVDDSDTDIDTDIQTSTRNLFLSNLISLPDNHFSISIIWDFELNYDYYKIHNVTYYPVCRSLNYRRKKLQIDRFNNAKNMKIGKYWEFPISNKFSHGNYLYFIIYFNIMIGHIDIQFYGIFDEEINENNAIKQIIDMGIYGTTGKLHKPNITCTDGTGFNFYKYNINDGW